MATTISLADEPDEPRRAREEASRRRLPLSSGLVPLLVGIALVTALAACATSPSGGDSATRTPADVTDPKTRESLTQEGESSPTTEGGSTAGLPGVDVDVTNAVAPFDHPSFVDSVLLEIAIGQVRTREINECMAAEGFDPPPPSGLPDRDDPSLVSNLTFPFVKRLAAQGFVRGRSDAPSPGDAQEPAGGEIDALIACGEELERDGTDSTALQETFGAVRGAWEEVLASIDASDEIAVLVGEFGECLRAQGIPPESSDSEGSFLVYVDMLILEADDPDRTAEIDRTMGKLYVECGRDLFERREQLRSGDLRESFLNEHAAAIQELNEQLFGNGTGS